MLTRHNDSGIVENALDVDATPREPCSAKLGIKNVWPAPSARSSMKVPVTGLHKRIRHVGTVAAAKMESRTSRAS